MIKKSSVFFSCGVNTHPKLCTDPLTWYEKVWLISRYHPKDEEST